MYRDEREALFAQCEALRAQLKEAAGDIEAERALRTKLEAKLEEIEAFGISKAKREAVVSAVRFKTTILVAVAVAMLLIVVGMVSFTMVRGLSELEESQRFTTSEAHTWFGEIRPRCNPVEVSTALRQNPPPDSDEGRRDHAVCLALAHRVDQARDVIMTLPQDQRAPAVDRMFHIIHPIADAGDDVAAGPVMELVVEFVPKNYMALFHAGIAAYETKRYADAKDYLLRFRAIYKRRDSWGARAIKALRNIDAQLGH